VVDAFALFVQADGLRNDVVHAQRDQSAVQAVAEGAGFVAAMDGVGQSELGFDPLQEFGRSEFCAGCGAPWSRMRTTTMMSAWTSRPSLMV
jgi:hypothetical protein